MLKERQTVQCVVWQSELFIVDHAANQMYGKRQQHLDRNVQG